MAVSPELERALAALRVAEQRSRHWDAGRREEYLDAFRRAVEEASQRAKETDPRA